MNFSVSNNKLFWGITISLLTLICVAYSNHFDNSFHFDDGHTIVGNEYIRDISNLPKFFTDVKYYGTMPNNRGYNPILVSLNAIDYWLAGSLDVRYFHASIFFSYLILLVLLYFMIQKIYFLSLGEYINELKLLSLLAVGFFGVHTANAETINYIIMRSDSFSTLCIIASLLLYQNAKWRKYKLYLITMLIGIGTKATGAMFGPILFIYAYLFEQDGNFLNLRKRSELIKLNAAFIQAMPATIIGFVAFYISRTQFVSENAVMFAGGNPYGIYQYFITQWVVMVHYLGNFILPLDLSGDPDFILYKSIINRKVLLSLALLVSIFIMGLIASTQKKYRPITFGIFWFFLALAPTSSFNPMGQVSNDHRTFFPYIGLVISLFWILYLLYLKVKQALRLNPVYKGILIASATLVYGLHAYGTYQRNEIWHDEPSLWYDVTIKSPNNGRGLMNYALTLMSKGKYDETLEYFERALKLMPYYSYLHINMGILKNAMGKPEEAEIYYKNSMRYDPYNAETYYYYAFWLESQNRLEEAIPLLEKGNKMSPGHAKISAYLNKLKQGDLPREDRIQKLMAKLNENPNATDYLNLSLAQYNMELYEDCIESCLLALKLYPNFAEAYNNICSAYIQLHQPEKAIEACKKAIAINPDFVLAKNNLKWAQDLESAD